MLIVRIRPGSGYYVVSINREMVPDEWNEGQAFTRQQFSAAKSEMAYRNHFSPNSLGRNAKSAMSFPSPTLFFEFLAACVGGPLIFPREIRV
jgi:hypothetical protein